MRGGNIPGDPQSNTGLRRRRCWRDTQENPAATDGKASVEETGKICLVKLSLI